MTDPETEYVHPATGETGHRGEMARMAEEYFTSLPRKTFSWEALAKIESEWVLKNYYCQRCLDGNHRGCLGRPENHWMTRDENGELAYIDGRATRTPWAKDTNQRSGDGTWNLYGQKFTETLQCQCAVHGHRMHPAWEGKCQIRLKDDWGRGAKCSKPAKGTVVMNSFGGVTELDPPREGGGYGGFSIEVPACGLHMGVAKRMKNHAEQERAIANARRETDQRAKENRLAAADWAEKLTELTGVQFTGHNYREAGIQVSVGPEVLWKVLDAADRELRAATGIGLRGEE
jgi:hypothetical protein